MLGTRTSPSAQRALARSGFSKEMSPATKFALRAQCGRGRPRSQQQAAHSRCGRLFGQIDDHSIVDFNLLPKTNHLIEKRFPFPAHFSSFPTLRFSNARPLSGLRVNLRLPLVHTRSAPPPPREMGRLLSDKPARR